MNSPHARGKILIIDDDEKITEFLRLFFLKKGYEAMVVIHAEEAEKMGLVNKVVPVEQLEDEGVAWAKQILEHSPLAIRLLKSAFNAELDGQAGIQELAGNATLLYYMSEEVQEGKNAYVEKRKPDFKKFPRVP